MPTTYAIPNGRTVMDATLWTGNDSATQTISNLQFQPDFVWGKNRTAAWYHNLFDSVRGAGSTKQLASNTAGAEGDGGYAGLYGYLSSFNSNGFTATAGTAAGNDKYIWWNDNGANYVAWCWQAGQGTTSTNTNGSISSTVSVNQTAGFSIVKYVGTGTTSTVGHGLGVAPAFIVLKDISSGAYNWIVYHQSIGATGYVHLNLTAATQTSSSGGWNDTAPTSTVFTLGSGNANANTNGNNNIAYCWAEVAGFSKFGSYTGNGSYGGPFVYTGFRPKFVMLKMTSSTNPWQMYDSSRDPYNYSYHILAANSSSAEDSSSGAGVAIDLLSNGFKIRTDWADINTNGGSYIYMAWAENPFKYANAR